MKDGHCNPVYVSKMLVSPRRREGREGEGQREVDFTTRGTKVAQRAQSLYEGRSFQSVLQLRHVARWGA